ncbi:nucleotide pyrophosphohydrolase [Microbacterium sp. OR16]|uniref:nucleotide pyrophosphohydrolase n=1 Tax=Microbacterium sp. OR16 TaxID=3095345 RepID=UPI0039B594FB
MNNAGSIQSASRPTTQTNSRDSTGTPHQINAIAMATAGIFATFCSMPSPATLQALREFAVERDWEQFHSPENLAKSISIEAAELLELFQWGQTPDQTRVEEELADVLTYCFQMAARIGVDIDEIVLSKLEKTRAKYPVEMSKGRIAKYTHLQ